MAADGSLIARTAPAGALGVAVVGLGVGAQHARAYAETAGCTLRWVYDLDAARMAAVVSDLNAGAPADSFGAILADGAVDVVSVASYDDAHYEQVMAALEAGKHVFAEKPLCRSRLELDAIKRAWRANGRRGLASNLVLRAAPLYCWLKDQITTGVLGEIYAFDGDYLYGRLHKITHGWRTAVEHYSVMQGGGVHLVDLMLWLTGQRPTTVVAAGNRISTADTAFRYDDFVSATFQFPSGLIGRITANFGCVHPHQHVVRVFGTRATFIYDDAGGRLHRTRADDGRAEAVAHAPRPSSKGALIPDFVHAIVTGREMTLSAQHEFDVISACVAADRALQASKLVEIEYA